MTGSDWAGYLRFRDQFEQVMDPRRHSPAWLDQQILSGRFLLWTGDKAAIVASVQRYPTGAADIVGEIAAGDLEEIVSSLVPQAEDWARSIGCIGAMISSRPGWAKALKAHGYEVHQVTVRKEF